MANQQNPDELSSRNSAPNWVPNFCSTMIEERPDASEHASSSKSTTKSHGKPNGTLATSLDSDSEVTQKIRYGDLKCPVCYDVCLPPIYQCVEGHIICEFCRDSISDQKCPQCRASLRHTIRNRVLESLVTTMDLPCRNKKFGCPEKLIGTKHNKHEQTCKFKPFRCIRVAYGCPNHDLDSSQYIFGSRDFRKCKQCLHVVYSGPCNQKFKTLQELQFHWILEHDNIPNLEPIPDARLSILRNKERRLRQDSIKLFCYKTFTRSYAFEESDLDLSQFGSVFKAFGHVFAVCSLYPPIPNTIAFPVILFAEPDVSEKYSYAITIRGKTTLEFRHLKVAPYRDFEAANSSPDYIPLSDRNREYISLYTARAPKYVQTIPLSLIDEIGAKREPVADDWMVNRYKGGPLEYNSSYCNRRKLHVEITVIKLA